MANKDTKNKNTDYSKLTSYYLNVTINGLKLIPTCIKSIVLREWVFDILPSVEIAIIDNGLLMEYSPLVDNTEIIIEMSKTQDKNIIIQNTFILQDFTVINTDIEGDRGYFIVMTAILSKKPLLYPIHNRSFTKMPSTDAIKKIATESGLEIENKITTSDLMTWLQINQNNYDMIYHLLSRAYKKDDAVFSYTGRDGKCIITSLNKELEKENSIKAIKSLRKAILDKEDENTTPDRDEEGSSEDDKNIYYTHYNYKNIFGTINKTIGYGSQFSFYDLKEERLVNIDSDIHPLTKYSFKEKDAVKKIVVNNTYGIKFSGDNTHDDYLTALVQNKYLTSTFFGCNLTLDINANNNVKLFDKILLTSPSVLPSESQEAKEINEAFSGEYLISGILHQINGNSNYKMILSCFRNGINKPQAAEKTEITLNDIQTKNTTIKPL